MALNYQDFIMNDPESIQFRKSYKKLEEQYVRGQQAIKELEWTKKVLHLLIQSAPNKEVEICLYDLRDCPEVLVNVDRVPSYEVQGNHSIRRIRTTPKEDVAKATEETCDCDQTHGYHDKGCPLGNRKFPCLSCGAQTIGTAGFPELCEDCSNRETNPE